MTLYKLHANYTFRVSSPVHDARKQSRLKNLGNQLRESN